MIFKKTTYTTVSATLCFFNIACTSPPEVRELAETTAVNSSLVATQFQDFAKNRKYVTNLRADAIASLEDAIAEQQAIFDVHLESDKAAATIAGLEKKPNYHKMANQILLSADIVNQRRKEALTHEAVIREGILSSIQALSLPTAELTSISKQMSLLAKEPSAKEQLIFFASFIKQTIKDIKDAKEDSNEATNNAEKPPESNAEPPKE